MSRSNLIREAGQQVLIETPLPPRRGTSYSVGLEDAFSKHFQIENIRLS